MGVTSPNTPIGAGLRRPGGQDLVGERLERGDHILDWLLDRRRQTERADLKRDVGEAIGAGERFRARNGGIGLDLHGRQHRRLGQCDEAQPLEGDGPTRAGYRGSPGHEQK
jgi:hypothetical protein